MHTKISTATNVGIPIMIASGVEWCALSLLPGDGGTTDVDEWVLVVVLESITVAEQVCEGL